MALQYNYALPGIKTWSIQTPWLDILSVVTLLQSVEYWTGFQHWCCSHFSSIWLFCQINFEMIDWRQTVVLCISVLLLFLPSTYYSNSGTVWADCATPWSSHWNESGKKKKFLLAHTQSVNVQEIQYWLRYRSSNETVVIVTTLRPTFASLSAVTVRACLCSDKSCQWNDSAGGCSLSTSTPVRAWRLEPGSPGVGVAVSVKICDECSH